MLSIWTGKNFYHMTTIGLVTTESKVLQISKWTSWIKFNLAGFSLNFLLRWSQWPPPYELEKVNNKFGGHLEKFGGRNPQNSKKRGGHGKLALGKIKNIFRFYIVSFSSLSVQWFCLNCNGSISAMEIFLCNFHYSRFICTGVIALRLLAWVFLTLYQKAKLYTSQNWTHLQTIN